ncbi:Os01g0602466 [Oryza sativa Japonica Group]|uniref:Os01g0602466 protein n=1 Tax=Oryza sativa subsp. japonica TaxID=39947 RepID=A0A0P0V4Y3_ORYSJ|nr:Os01g0602466 [Oryza sativa Japonica Group]
MTSPVRLLNSGQQSTSYEPSEPMDPIHLLISSSQHAENTGSMSLSFSSWKTGLRILLCLAHFSPSWADRPWGISFDSSGKLTFSKWPNLLDRTTLASSGSATCTSGVGPNQVMRGLPCAAPTPTAPWRNGSTRGAMSWHRSGSGLAQASFLRRPSSARSPVRKR